MSSIATDIRRLIASRVESATAAEILAIASALPSEGAQSAPIPVAQDAKLRFQVDGDIVADALTGLQWSRTNVAGGRMNWAEAKKAAAAVNLGGHSDWRLPTVRELLSLVDYERSEPAIDPAFECESAWYWTSTPYKPSPGDYAWFVNFSSGYSYYSGQTGGNYVRAVRASQLVGFLGSVR